MRRLSLPLLIILLFYGAYAAFFIYRTSFIIDGQRYFSLFDDSMISMRYAKNLSEGNGLVWNPGGEEVEGFTNPLWVLYMAVFHLFPIPVSKVSLFIQISGGLFLILSLFVVAKMPQFLFTDSHFHSITAVILTAFYLPLNNWSLQGTEAGVLTFLVVVAVWIALRRLDNGRFTPWLYVLLGVGTLVRMDMVVSFLAITIFLVAVDSQHRGRHLLWGGLVLLASLGGQTAFRLWYYHDVLPNTYYLKLTGYPLLLRLTRGLAVTWDFVARMSVPLFLLPFALLFFKRDRRILLLVSVFLAQLAYSIYVGGDAWEYWGGSNRYVSIVMPLFFILLCGSLANLESTVIGKVRTMGRFAKGWARSIVIIVLLLALVRLNLIYSPYATLEEWLLLKPPLAVTDNEKMVMQSLLLKEITDPQATIAVVWAGAIPYFSERSAVDILGKNDRIIAREAARIPNGSERFTAFYPGHMKWDYHHSITELKPDVIVQLYGVRDAEIDPYLVRDYWKVLIGGFVFHMHMDSRHVNWDKINSMEQKWRHEESLTREQSG